MCAGPSFHVGTLQGNLYAECIQRRGRRADITVSGEYAADGKSTFVGTNPVCGRIRPVGKEKSGTEEKKYMDRRNPRRDFE